MPWSIFTDGGGAGAALTWAQDLLKQIGAPVTAGNEQFIYDWEKSEGGGGKFNPLNQGPVPGDPSLTTTGQQYGGGAADFASWQAGLTGAADYLAMPNYQGISSALMANDPQAAKAALIASPWASSHYGGGAGFSSASLPGSAAPLAAGGGSVTGAGSSGSGSSFDPLTAIGDAITGGVGTVQHLAIIVPVVLAGAALAVFGLVKMTGTHPVHDAGKAAQAAGTVAAVAA